MKDVILDTLIDSLKLIPFLFVAFLIIELIEHKFSKKTKKVISKSGKFGPLLGSILGLFPQCGFSVMATNLYVTRIISLGTLIAIYLSTSDEMLPIMLSHNVEASLIFTILGIKFLVGVVFGFIIDFFFFRRKKEVINYDICSEEGCHCESGLVLSTVKHTVHTILFIALVSFALNTLVYYVGEERLSLILLKDNIFSFFLSSLIGLIPNCASSIMITELYLSGALSLGSAMAGLLTGSGVSLLVLFKSNKNFKENLFILLSIYVIGVFSGICIELFQMLI